MDLLALNDNTLVEKTNLSRKLTLGGMTKAYPVYRVRLDLLFYNDQNDRIATWITQYKNDPSKPDFGGLSGEEYNNVIQQFIIDSNPAAIEKTKNNIALVNQREPGVVLKDGRIIDGNRRFTCLRLLHKTDPSFNYLETVILDDSGESSQKQIKMLELAIQHGEEQRVDYNLIDLTIGAYHDIIETGLLTIKEYASSTNETESEVKKRLEVAQLIIEFLEFMKVPKQYHIAREMQVYSVFFELVPLLKKCEDNETREALKTSVFTNTMMTAFADQRKYTRNLRAMMDTGLFYSYIKRQERICEELEEKKNKSDIKNETDIKAFVKENADIKEDLQTSMERSLLQSKKTQTKNRQSQLVEKSIDTLMDIDTRIVDKLSEDEKDKLSHQLRKLTEVADLISNEINPLDDKKRVVIRTEEKHKQFLAAVCQEDDPFVYCTNRRITITNLSFSLPFSAGKYYDGSSENADYIAVFVDEKNEALCAVRPFSVRTGETIRVSFTLNSAASSLDSCYLVLRAAKDAENEARSIQKCGINTTFKVDVDF